MYVSVRAIIKGRTSPPSRRGRRADHTMQRYLKEIGATGEVRRLYRFQQVSDLPGRADAKVAMHSVDRRVHPSSKEGPVDSRFVRASNLILCSALEIASQMPKLQNGGHRPPLQWMHRVLQHPPEKGWPRESTVR